MYCLWFIFHSLQNLVVEKETMSLTLEGQDMEEDDVFGRSIVLKIRKDTVVGQETLAQSGGMGPRTL